MLKRPDEEEQKLLESLQDPSDIESYKRTRLHDVKAAIRHSWSDRAKRDCLDKTAEFQEIADSITGEVGRRIRALLFLQSRLLKDIQRNDLDEDPICLESGRAVIDSNCHQTVQLVMGQINYWGKMKASKILNSNEDLSPIWLRGIPRTPEQLAQFEVLGDPDEAISRWGFPVHVIFEEDRHSAIIVAKNEESYTCFEQNGQKGPLRFKPLAEISKVRGQAKFVRPKA
ncbi:hypothetical protein GW756_01365 [bacterium]|nr:hypothetical protein [bacterium]NCQ55004.1 hypothetical protein [Candidatus Parcubacteria bacterium]NCS67048.1 hypothetical protein [Candidatus Peregrinibacteria bacterium]NCS95994.1 hypothetical protein [bacterium]